MIELGILFLLVRNLGTTLRKKNRSALLHQVVGSIVFIASESIGWAIAATVLRPDVAYVGAFSLGGAVAFAYWRLVKRLPPLDVPRDARTSVSPRTPPPDTQS